MELIGFVIIFMLAIFLISRGVNMGLSLLGAAFFTGIIASTGFWEIITIILSGMFSVISIQLMVIVGLISGLSFIMKKTGDLELMIDSLNSLLNNVKNSVMVIPALIGTLNIPGGAILSAPMIEESGNYLNLNASEKNSINIFFRHIGFFVYPLYPSMILTGELLNIPVINIIKFTLIPTLGGLITAYFSLFKDVKQPEDSKHNYRKQQLGLIDFLAGFSSILVILILALIVKIPFHYAVLIGTLIALGRNLTKEKNKLKKFIIRLKDFLIEGIDYKLVFTIASLMAFKEIIETTGLINQITEIIIGFNLSLPFLIVFMGLLIGYLSGVHVAATGMLVPLLLPMLPPENIALYGALSFVAINIGYIISPLHLCLVLGNEYFDDNINSLYKKLVYPLLIMIFISLLQVWIFA